MESREEMISTAYGSTCAWIWERQPAPVDAPSKSADFKSWLQDDMSPLWISGKAGSGKSTLMKYVSKDTKTEAELQRSSWASGRDLMLVKHFFYDRGDDFQSSREGMLRSLIHQMLSHRRDLIPQIFPEGNSLRHSLEHAPQTPMRLPTWTDLGNPLFSILDRLQDSRICLFLDGIDEYRMIDKIKEYTEEELDLMFEGDNEDEA